MAIIKFTSVLTSNRIMFHEIEPLGWSVHRASISGALDDARHQWIWQPKFHQTLQPTLFVTCWSTNDSRIQRSV